MPRPSRTSMTLAALIMSTAGAAVAADPTAGQANSPAPAAAAKPASPAGPVVTEIVVTGSRPAVENRVDRKVYAISGDLQADIGSAADVLRNVPSVSIDIDGNPMLRGDPGVQILVDGRYRPEYNGANRGAALEQLAASGIDRIEVMTNPPARYKREGTSGIINIITKRATGARTASAQASLGSGNRYNVNTSQGAQFGALNLRGTAVVRRDRRIRDIEARRIVRDDSGVLENTRDQRSHDESDRLSKKISLGADYELDDKNRLSAEGSFYRRDADGSLIEHIASDDAAGAPLSRYDRTRRSNEYEYSSDAQLRYRRAGATDDDEFSVSLERSEELERRPLHSSYLPSLPVAPVTFQDQLWIEDAVTTEFSVDYATSWVGGRKFTAGYDLQVDDNSFDGEQTLPALEGEPRAPDPAFTNVFRYEQTLHALYATIEQPIADWTFLAGVRLEQAALDVKQATSGERSRQDYFRVYPSLHLARKLNGEQMLTFSYARRVQRPYWQQFNPFVLQFQADQFQAGNPDLQPSLIDSLEAGWSRDQGSSSLSASVYARRTHDSVSYVTILQGTNSLITPVNLGDDRSGGLELVAAGKLGTRLGYNVSFEAMYQELDGANVGFERKRSAFTAGGKAALNWRFSESDRMQVNVAVMGKEPTPQGYDVGSTVVDLGYRHQFRPGLSLTATVSDAFASRRHEWVIDTPTLYEHNVWRNPGRIAWIGITWTLVSGNDNAPDKFEYEK